MQMIFIKFYKPLFVVHYMKKINKRGQVQPAVTTASPPEQSSATSTPGVTDVSARKSKWWIWVVLALVVIGAGAGIYFVLIQ